MEPEHGRDRANILGLAVDRLDMRATVLRCAELIEQTGPSRQVSVNAAKLVQCADDPELARFVNRSDVVSADGQAVVLAARLLGDPLPGRVAGIDLMDRLCAEGSRRGWRAFVLGARPEVLERALGRLKHRYPGLVVAGARDGYYLPEEEPDVVAQIEAARADLLFVAMPSPAKERFLDENINRLGVGFAMGVGGSVDVIAGERSRAPGWMQRAGLEWLYRMLQEPRRMWRRYFVGNLRFGALLVAGIARRATGR